MFDENAPVTDYVPEFSETAWDGATIRHLLNHQSGVEYSFAPTKEKPYGGARAFEFGTPEFLRAVHPFARYWRAMGLMPQSEHERGTGVYDVTLSLGKTQKVRPHGELFNYGEHHWVALQLILERALGRPFEAILAEQQFQRLHTEHSARIWVDGVGTAIPNAGTFCTARDLARWGQCMLDDGKSAGTQVGPCRFLIDALENPTRGRYTTESNGWGLLPAQTGYRNMVFVDVDEGEGSGPLLYASGAFGQKLVWDVLNRNVIVKMSSIPESNIDLCYVRELPALRSFSKILPALVC